MLDAETTIAKALEALRSRKRQAFVGALREKITQEKIEGLAAVNTIKLLRRKREVAGRWDFSPSWRAHIIGVLKSHRTAWVNKFSDARDREDSGKKILEESTALRELSKTKGLPPNRIAKAIVLFTEAARRARADENIDDQTRSYIAKSENFDLYPSQIEMALRMFNDRTVVYLETDGGKSLAIGLLAYLKVLNGEKVRVEDWGNILATRNAQAIGAVLEKLGVRVCMARRESLLWFSPEQGDRAHPHLTPIRPGTDEKVDVIGAAQFWDVMYGTHEEMRIF